MKWSENFTNPPTLKYGYAGDRQIAVQILDFLLAEHSPPEILFVSDKTIATHDHDLISRCPFLKAEQIIRGNAIGEAATLELLRKANLDFIICVHFPYILRQEVLSIPSEGVLNIHPAYLPFNRGWNTPSWAIYEGTKYGATIHFMNESLDMGDIVGQKELPVRPEDTADSLYKKVLNIEYLLFREIWPNLVNRHYVRRVQKSEDGTTHIKKDLATLQQLDLDVPATPRNVITRLRALTTNSLREAAYFEEKGKKYYVQISIHPDSEEQQ